MAGAAKGRANQERELANRLRDGGSSSGHTSSSGKASRSMHSSASASGSRAPSHRSSAAPSHRSSTRAGYDGNRDPDAPGPAATRNPNTSRPQVSDNMGRSLDLGTVGFSRISGQDVPPGLPPRQAPSKLGTATTVTLNSFPVVKLPTERVYQYEVLVGNGAEKRGLIDAVWRSKAIRDALGNGWIFDGEPTFFVLSTFIANFKQVTVSRGR